MARLTETRCSLFLLALAAIALAAPWPAAAAERKLDFERLAALRSVQEVELSPDGTQVAYTLGVPRRPGADDDGTPWSELHLVAWDGGPSRAFVHGEVNVSGIRFTPDGNFVTYLAKRGEDEHHSLWAIPVAGGESIRLVEHDSRIRTYGLSPDGKRVAFVATEPESDQRERARKKGYKQEVYEEDWRPRKIWIAAVPPYPPPVEDPSAGEREDAEEKGDEEPRELAVDGSVFELEWSGDGKHLALTVAATPLIDDRYMSRRIQVIDAAGGDRLGTIDNPGKLGAFRVSPDGKNIAMISAADPNDPKEGRLLVAPATGGVPRDVLPGLEGHVHAIAWQDSRTLMYLAGQGVESVFGEVDVTNGATRTHATSNGSSRAPWLERISIAAEGRRAALRGQCPAHPAEVYVMGHGDREPRKLTDSNPWLAGVDLAPQEVVRWQARDGLELEGVLIRPLEPVAGSPPPLILSVHGGPESHDRNGWVTSYSRPGQVAAARGYAVFYPNYRGSTGRGVEFSKTSQGDAAGKEFDDLVDAVNHLVAEGIADRDRVGITGGSYGGYATAWCSTYHTEHFRAGVMFVGISNKVSKGLTTEIPVEDKMVHTRFDPWTRWQFSLERSPIFHAEKSRTALMIAGGTADTRVHPSQSLQLFRALKLMGKTPVRYVRYPGEGHGNRRAAARDDYARRLMRWMDHFVRDKKAGLPEWEAEWASVEEDSEEEDEDEDEDD